MFTRISIAVLLAFFLIANNNSLAQDKFDKNSDFKFLPVLEPDFNLGLTLSLKTGIMNLSNFNSGTQFISGAEAAFNCLMFKPANENIRAQFSYNRYEDDKFTIHTIELNPYYMFDVTDNFSIGGGPGIGYIIPGSDMDNAWSLQAGFGASYNLGLITLGVDARYQWQISDNNKLAFNDLDNFRTNLKIGINL
jgi:hypothetical protein